MKINFVVIALFLLFFALFFTSCEKLVQEYGPVPPDENELLDGPVEGLTTAEQIQFLDGDISFNDEVFTSAKGLGPIFVGTSCVSCHSGDGKGHPFNQLIRFGQSDSLGNPFATFGDGGNQIQNKAIPGFRPEQLPPGAPFTVLIAPAVTGLGFLDAVSDADILSLSDPNDEDGDGISGRPHYNVPPNYTSIRPNSIPKGNRYIFRFGKKAVSYNLLQQTVDAYNQDIGITSIYGPIDPHSGLEVDPEISTQTLNDVVFYLKTLKAPIPRNQDNPEVIAGRKIFNDIQCAKCHIPTLQTGFSPIEAISFKEFHPFSDLLLHDMGPDLDDGYTEGFAQTFEWRTPPLWGIGLAENSQGGGLFLLHDGRARSIEEAILLHGGEAENSKNSYSNLSVQEKEQLLKFIKSL